MFGLVQSLVLFFIQLQKFFVVSYLFIQKMRTNKVFDLSLIPYVTSENQLHGNSEDIEARYEKFLY